MKQSGVNSSFQLPHYTFVMLVVWPPLAFHGTCEVVKPYTHCSHSASHTSTLIHLWVNVGAYFGALECAQHVHTKGKVANHIE